MKQYHCKLVVKMVVYISTDIFLKIGMIRNLRKFKRRFWEHWQINLARVWPITHTFTPCQYTSASKFLTHSIPLKPRGIIKESHIRIHEPEKGWSLSIYGFCVYLFRAHKQYWQYNVFRQIVHRNFSILLLVILIWITII